MNGRKMRLEKVESPAEPQTSEPSEKQEASPPQKETAMKEKGAKVISLEDLKRK